MKLLAKVLFVGVIGTVGVGLTTFLHAAPGSVWDSNGTPSNASFEEMMIRARDARDAMIQDYRHIQHLQQVARKEKDVVKLNCVNDKLVQVKPLMNDADRERTELEANVGNRRTYFGDIVADVSSIHRLREEADQCVGEGIPLTESSNSFSGPQLPDSPYGDPFGPIGEPPGYASPFN